uniref:hypothetical protein n=1 Tax=Candidatus Phytoplasma prunorum TaxID=47565 RepID=UPI002FEF60C3
MNKENFLNKVIIVILLLIVFFGIYYCYDYFVHVKPRVKRIQKLEQMGNDLTVIHDEGTVQRNEIQKLINSKKEELRQTEVALANQREQLRMEKAALATDKGLLNSKENEFDALKKAKEKIEKEIEEKKLKGTLSSEDVAYYKKQINELQNKMDILTEEINVIRKRIRQRENDIIIQNCKINELNLVKKEQEQTIKELEQKNETLETVIHEIEKELIQVAGLTEKNQKEHDKYLNQGIIERCLNIFGQWGEAWTKLPTNIVNENEELLNKPFKLIDSFTITTTNKNGTILKHENQILGHIASPTSVKVLQNKLNRELEANNLLIKKIKNLENENIKSGFSEFGLINKKSELRMQIKDIELREIPNANIEIEFNQQKIGNADFQKQKL